MRLKKYSFLQYYKMGITKEYINENYNELNFRDLNNLNFETLKYVLEISELNDKRSEIYEKNYLITINGKSKKFTDSICFPNLIYNNRKNIDWDINKALEIENLINEKDIDYKNKTHYHKYSWNFLIGTEILNNKHFLIDSFEKIDLSKVMIENPNIIWDYQLFDLFVKQIDFSNYKNYFEIGKFNPFKSNIFSILKNLENIKITKETIYYHCDFFDKYVIITYEEYKKSEGYEFLKLHYQIWEFIMENKNIDWDIFLQKFASKNRGIKEEKDKSYELGFKKGHSKGFVSGILNKDK
jgi:hypothetical protein